MATPLFETEKVVSPEVEQESVDLFRYNKWTEKMEAQGEAVREALRAAHLVIIANVPPGKDREVALRQLRNCRMWCNSAITFGGRY